MADIDKKIVFICSPFAGDIKGNSQRARRYGRFAVSKGAVPFVPHLLYPQILNEHDPEERNLGINLGLNILAKCQELWVFGEYISPGMSIEINQAKKLMMPIKYFSTSCKEMKNEKDCFAYKNKKCTILTINKCKGPDCSFLKTKEQAKEEQEKIIERIRSLDRETQKFIIDTYYKGKLEVK
ncbi:hypothetical protein SYNTR_0929 [Candidatus Syntrophocurvum alkaliphilum]|uniref:DUF7768 domain-containing protein n=1 Tax=Candidatus Syntrophocurvum alkaliphilum TaxID=2293317 RepID=A0A6I6DEU6_9FIRM|nr:DUF4406 domain-containing protein [Candidatus Syntrophocurvum alkaliphilum]QGT99522.1 hypothetical protein SYNTR_0929 [Candidatus Syntrophocurvum alkaliphilum]